MKVFYIVLGFISLVFGIVGIFLPILPTTPFLLLTLFCFTKGSDRLRAWFITTDIYKNYVQEFEETWTLSLKAKIKILAISTTSLLIAFYFTPLWIGRAIIILAFIVKYYFFFFVIKTKNSYDDR